jgi:D-alanyl-D-alanine carboxypeptidase/D-alanyl-D-alanine-endopeptidase (penicillin-binding protein 4)
MLRVVLVIVLVVVAAAVGGVALYASTSDESGGTPAAGVAVTPAPSTPAAPTPAASTPSPAAPSASRAPLVPALWQHAASAAAPVLVPVSLDAGPDPTTAGLSATLAPLLADKAFAGDSVAMLVADASGHVLFSHAAGAAVPPASTAKLAVAVAALQILGPDHRFYTSVRKGPAAGEIVLVGGGDPTLTGPAALGPLSPGYPTPASLVVLASNTVGQLRAQGVTTVSLGYDASLFVGPQLAAGWKPIYQTEGDVAPVSALEVDEGAQVLTRPGRLANPASAAAAEFAALLTADGLTVTGVPQPTKAPSTPVTVASVASPPLSQLVQRMLGQSDNDLAEALARQVAIATGHPASFTGGAAAVKAAVAQLGVEPSGLAMVDASGLSPLDRVQPLALTQLMRLAVVPGHDRLTSILTGLPVAGFSGTLSGRFGGQAVAGAGVIRAKTGTLDGVVALAGYLQDSSGATLVFVTIVTGVAKTAGTSTETAVDRLTAGLPTCGCR